VDQAADHGGGRQLAGGSWPGPVVLRCVPAASRPATAGGGSRSVGPVSDLRPAGCGAPGRNASGAPGSWGASRKCCGASRRSAQRERSPGQESAGRPLLLAPTSSWSGKATQIPEPASRSSWRSCTTGRRPPGPAHLAIEEITPKRGSQRPIGLSGPVAGMVSSPRAGQLLEFRPGTAFEKGGALCFEIA